MSSGDLFSLADSTVSSNSSAGRGGGLFLETNSSVSTTILNSTFMGNSAYGYGGGVFWSPRAGATVGSLTLTDVTIQNNEALISGGGGLAIAPDNTTAKISVIINGGVISGNMAGALGGGVFANLTSVVASGTTISGNRAAAGGGFATPTSGVESLFLTFVGVTINQNIADALSSNGDGGGLLIPSGTASISLIQCDVSGNSTDGAGGGIFLGAQSSGGSLTVTDSRISGNSASWAGGGIYNRSATLSFNRTAITNNSATSSDFGNGGGVYSRTADISLVNSSLSGNSSIHGLGGGIHLPVGGNLTVTGSTIAGNTARIDGGGIWATIAKCTIVTCTISGNSSSVTGGLYLRGNTTIRNSTIANNSGGSSLPGGVYAGLGTQRLELDHTIIAGNSSSAGSSPDIRFLTGTSTVTLRYSLIGDDTGTPLVEAPLGSPDINGNLIGKAVSAGGSGVIDPLLGPLADNGGFLLPDGSHIKTHALLPGSPALDGGALVTGPPQGYDQRGNPFSRMVDGTGDGVVRIDMGAYESQGVPHFSPGDYNRDGLVDACDYTEWRESFGSQREPFSGADGNGNGIVDQSDYEIWKSHFGQGLTFTSGGGDGGGGGLTSMAMESVALPPAEPGAVGVAIDVALPDGLPLPPAALRGVMQSITPRRHVPRARSIPNPTDQALAWWSTQNCFAKAQDAITATPAPAHSNGCDEEEDDITSLDLAFAALVT